VSDGLRWRTPTNYDDVPRCGGGLECSCDCVADRSRCPGQEADLAFDGFGRHHGCDDFIQRSSAAGSSSFAQKQKKLQGPPCDVASYIKMTHQNNFCCPLSYIRVPLSLSTPYGIVRYLCTKIIQITRVTNAKERITGWQSQRY